MNQIPSKTSIAFDILKDIESETQMLEDDPTFDKLRMTCRLLAEYAHMKQMDLAGKPYIEHPKRLAAKATTAYMACLLMLHDVVEDGCKYGITLESLKHECHLPQKLLEDLDRITRRDAETYNEYLQRTLSSYTVTKAKLLDTADNYDITRFDDPTRRDFSRCKLYLSKAMFLKNQECFQKELPFDYINDIIDLASLRPLTIEATTTSSNSTVLYEVFDGCSKVYLLKVSKCIPAADGVKIQVAVRSLLGEDNGFSNSPLVDRQTTMLFRNYEEVEQYISGINSRIAKCSDIKNFQDFING